MHRAAPPRVRAVAGWRAGRSTAVGFSSPLGGDRSRPGGPRARRPTSARSAWSLPALPRRPLPQPRLPLLRPRAGGRAPARLHRGARDGSAFRAHPQPATSPRPLYHRHFMLTEHMSGAGGRGKALPESYARHIGHKFRAKKVTPDRGQTHNLPTMELVRDGGRLDDPAGFEVQTPGGLPMRRILNLVVRYLVDSPQALAEGWDAFWYTPADPTLLGMIRILTGLMLLYTHAVWGLALDDFFAPNGLAHPPPSSGPSSKASTSTPSGGRARRLDLARLRALDGRPWRCSRSGSGPAVTSVLSLVGRGLLRPSRLVPRRCSGSTRSTSC